MRKLASKVAWAGACCGVGCTVGGGARGGTHGSCEGSAARNDLPYFRYPNLVRLGEKGSLKDSRDRKSRYAQNSRRLHEQSSFGAFRRALRV